ncbi:MAG: HTH domain-containing protein [Kofleriaceae bacterium]|nr:HTH domain-containing protein [Kofleriaceae bacterium]
MRRTERLFALSEHLRGRKTGVTADSLAKRFGVTVRTMYRDLDTLRAAHFPVHAERGRGGGFSLDRNYNIPPVSFNAREAALLVVAGDWLINLRLIPFVSTLKSAIDKVRAGLPAAGQSELQRLQHSISYSGVPTKAAVPKVREVVEEAWFEGSAMTICYEGSSRRTTRRVRIEQVIMDRNETLLNCFDLDKEAKRQFKLHRIISAEICTASD